MEINRDFLLEIFFTFCKRPLHKRYQNVYNAECPVCGEGKSAGRSRRLFYFPNKDYLYCHNCVQSWKPLSWIKQVTGWSVAEILRANANKGNVVECKEVEPLPEIEQSDLPDSSICISDAEQFEYFKTNKFVKIAHEYCVERRLFSAVNTCQDFYVSLSDKVHKNRLVIPFRNHQGSTVCYQTRALTKNQFPKYLTKIGEKSVFGIERVSDEIPYVFIFEGPIDSMFVKNGVAIASLNPTEAQLNQLQTLIGAEQIFVFDNDKNNDNTKKRIEKHIQSGKKIFIWPKEFSRFKDFNEICCSLGIDEIPWNFVVKNSMSGVAAQMKFKLTAG